MFTIQKVRSHVQSIGEEYIPPKIQQRFMTGTEALGLTGFSSLNGNGRLLSANRHTGESRVRRAVTDQRFPRLILRAIVKRYLPEAAKATGGRLRFSLDHSQFGDFYIAWIAVSIGKGRALPVWCVMARFHRGQLLKPLLRGLRILLSELSYEQRRSMTITMDRWFGIPELLTWLDDEHIRFIVRMKGRTQVGVPWEASGQRISIRDISVEDTPITYAERDWRLVRSDYDSSMKEDEPWWLLTNIPLDQQHGSRRHILNLYAERFEIEEFFKDIKWVQRYKWQLLRRAETLHSVLLFAALGWWILAVTGRDLIRKSRSRAIHPKKRLSWFRTVWEHWQRLRLQPLFSNTT
jgi:hypothetical protein